MKKIISYILLMALCLSLLVGCQEAPATNTEPTTAPTTAPTEPTLDAKEGLEKAKTYLYNLYKDSAEKTVKSFDVVAIVNMQEYGIYNVTWTVDNEAITFAPSEKSDKMITVVIPSPDAEIAYKLTATISDGKGNSATVEFNHIVPASIGMIVNPVPGVPYKMSMFHGNHGKDLYFIGKARDSQPWYMTSSDYIDEAIDVYLEEVTGGLRLYFFVDDVKTYLDMHKDGTHYSLRLTTTPTAVYTWNTEYNTLVAQVEDKQCFIGTSGTASYYTFSCNKIDTIANDFVAHLYGAGGIVVEPEQPSQPDPTDPVNPNEPTIPPVTSPVAGTTYKFGMYQKTNGHTVYIAGGIDQDRYLITTTDKAAALDVTVEASGNGFKFAVTINGTKLYITAGTNSAGKVALSYTAEGSVFTYDATISAWCTDVNGTVNYIGSYSNFDTLSLSKTSYISADNKGVTQFPAGLYEAN